MKDATRNPVGAGVGKRRTVSNSEALRRLMDRHKLTRDRVAELCVVQRSTVDSWLAPKDASSYRAMPNRAIDLLELRLQIGNTGPKARKTE